MEIKLTDEEIGFIAKETGYQEKIMPSLNEVMKDNGKMVAMSANLDTLPDNPKSAEDHVNEFLLNQAKAMAMRAKIKQAELEARKQILNN